MKLLSLILITLLLSPSIAQELPNRVGSCGPSTKITFSETVLPSDRINDNQFYFVSSNNQIVFFQTTDGHVYRSTNEGVTWKKQTVPSILPNLDPTKLISSIFHTQVKDDQSITLFLLSGGGEGKLWISQDAGETYTYVDTIPAGTFELYPNAVQKGLFLARRNVGTTHELWLGDAQSSTVKFSKLVDNIPPDSPASWSAFSNTNSNRIYVMQYKGVEKNPYHTQLLYSEDWFRNVTILSPENVLTWYHVDPDKFIVITCTNITSCSSKSMHISEDGGKTFYTPAFPSYRKNTPVESNFYVFEISDNAIWARVERTCNEDVCWGDMFHSDSGDKDFTLSLPYLSHWDFTKYASVDGIYVANQYMTSGGAPESSDGVRSVITFNKGSQWDLLKPPLVNSKGQPYQDANGNLCDPKNGCSLHIHGWSSPDIFSYFYSTSNAIGIMVASGNVGNRLQERSDDMSVFVSSSGGTSWTEVRQGNFVPEIGDHGSILTLVDGKQSTNEVLYNIGDFEDLHQWFSCQFGNDSQKIIARNIRVSKGWDSTRFLLYGQRRDAATNALNAVIIHINFDKEFSGKCTDSDFEPWTPKNIHGNCVMGRATTYFRRAKGKTCYFGEDHEKKTETSDCECHTEDYECDHCFFRPDLSSDCQLECTTPNMPLPPEGACSNSTSGFYSVEMFGYRKIDNDTCDPSRPGSEKPIAKIPCQFAPSDTSGRNNLPFTADGNSWIIVVVALFLLLLGAGVVAYLWNYNESFYNCVKYTLGVNDNRTVVAYHTVEEQEALTAEENKVEEDSLDA